MYQIKCQDLTGEGCGFVAREESKEKAKEVFYQHGVSSPLHRDKYHSASRQEAESFSKQLDEYLEKQD